MTKFDKQFKMDAVQYYHDHRDLGLIGCAHNLGISQQTLSRWQKQLRDNGEMPYRGSGNYASDEAKEIARLKRELRDAKDTINVLKKAISIHQQAYMLVFEYINTFYNTVRIHSHCNYMSPNDYEKLYAN